MGSGDFVDLTVGAVGDEVTLVEGAAIVGGAQDTPIRRAKFTANFNGEN